MKLGVEKEKDHAVLCKVVQKSFGTRSSILALIDCLKCSKCIYLFYIDILAKPFLVKVFENENKTMKLSYAFSLCWYILSVKRSLNHPVFFPIDHLFIEHPTARPYITVVHVNSRQINPEITSYLTQQDLTINIRICEWPHALREMSVINLIFGGDTPTWNVCQTAE
jgi:hypothetical protein